MSQRLVLGDVFPDVPAVVLDKAVIEQGFPERSIRIDADFVGGERGLWVHTCL